MPESILELIITYIGGFSLWVLEGVLIFKCISVLNIVDFNIFERNADNHEAVEIIGKIEEIELTEEVICAICLDIVLRGISLPACKHSFHKECIIRWIEIHSNCPYCRISIQ